MSGTQDIIIVRMGNVRLQRTFAKPLEEIIALLLLNQFETYWDIIPDSSVVLDLAPLLDFFAPRA